MLWQDNHIHIHTQSVNNVSWNGILKKDKHFNII